MSKLNSVKESIKLFSLPNFFNRRKRLIQLTIVNLILITASLNAQVDTKEFPPGHPNVSVSAVDQLKTFPIPRFKNSHALLPNFNWIDPVYFGGRFQPGITDAQAVTNSTEIQNELAKNFNYYVNVSWSGDNFNTAWKNLANAHPEYKVGLLTFRAQTRNGNPTCAMWSQSFPNDHYMQNSAGQMIDAGGNLTSNKTWRPTAPLADYDRDGAAAREFLNSALSGLTHPVNLVNEDGEVYPIMENNALSKDPVVIAAKNASGLDWENYYAKQVRLNDNRYSSQFMSLPILSSAKYTQYRLDGHRDYQLRWEQTKFMGSSINGNYYSTADFYVRWPNNWKDWSGPWHGLKWITQSRHFEIAAGDKLFSPFVSAGYDANPENDVRPAQWLGLLKLLGIYGAEFYYSCYFNEQGNYNPPNPPPYDPKGYAWQAVMPSYSQAVTSRYEDILKNGSLMAGDMTDNSNSTGAIPYYQFNTGASNKVVAIRKKDNSNVYAITGSIQNSSNVLNSTPLTGEASITLNGQNLKFNIRRQGSTYIYDNSISTAPVFYQLDAWHEATHPSWWTKDFNIEAELFDNQNSNAVIKTSVPAGTSAGDFRNATSYVGFKTVSDLQYNFQPRGTTTNNYYLWVCVRSQDATSTGFTVKLDGTNLQQFDCITSKAWTWYRYNISNQAVTYANLSIAPHVLTISPFNTKLEIDKIAIITSNSAVYGNATSPCSGSSATITAGGPTAFCQGGNVVLTANTGTSYLWSNGSVSKSITVSTTGNYSVTVTTNGIQATSAPVNVTVYPQLTATITASGSLNLNQGATVTLTASSGTNYLWLPGNQTTSSITVNTAGSYSVRVTNSNGCSATSVPALVTVSGTGGPLNVTITPSGPTTFCQGESVNLSATAGNTYLWSTGQTTQTITANTSASYVVTVTSGTQTGVSAPQTVKVNSVPNAVITANSSLAINQGSTVTMTSSDGASFLWLPGNQTTKSITVGTAGNYTVKVTKKNGCSKTSAPVTVTINGSSLCAFPTGLSATSVSKNSATLNWNNIAVDSLQIKLENITYVYPYITSMFRGSFNQITVGVQGGSSYKWYIRSKCGLNYSEWSPYSTFVTPLSREIENPAETSLQVEKVITETEINVFPNPTHGISTISFQSADKAPVYIKLLDFTGKLILEKTIQASEGYNEMPMDLKNYPTGIYLLIININDSNYRKKVIVN